MDLAALEKQLRGAKFGELVLEHYKMQDFPTLTAAFRGTQDQLPPAARPLVESWLDEVGRQGGSEDFWRADCADVFTSTIHAAEKKIALSWP